MLVTSLAFSAGLGFGLVFGLAVALWFSHRAYMDVREERKPGQGAPNFGR